MSATSWHMVAAILLPMPEEAVYDPRRVVIRASGIALGSVHEAPSKPRAMVAVLCESYLMLQMKEYIQCKRIVRF